MVPAWSLPCRRRNDVLACDRPGRDPGHTSGRVDPREPGLAGFCADRATWRLLKATGGYKLGIFKVDGRLEVVQPVYRRPDPNCCPTGGFDRVLYRFDGRRPVGTRRWHTRTFVRLAG